MCFKGVNKGKSVSAQELSRWNTIDIKMAYDGTGEVIPLSATIQALLAAFRCNIRKICKAAT